MSNEPNPGVIVDPLFVGLTRPAMVGGVTYSALLLNGILTLECFLVTRNLLALLIGLPVHGLCYLLCLNEPRFFDLLRLWALTRAPAWLGTLRFWRANTYSPLAIDLPNSRGRRRTRPSARPSSQSLAS